MMNEIMNQIMPASTTTNGELVKAYASAHTEPKQDKCPTVFTQWRRKDGWYIHNSATGEIDVVLSETYRYSKNDKEHPEYGNGGHVFSANGNKGYDAVYVDYVPEFNMIEISPVHTNGYRCEEGETRPWKFLKQWYNSNRLFMFKGDRYLYDENGNHRWETEEGKKYNTHMKYYMSALQRMIYSEENGNEFKKFAGCEKFRISKYSDCINYPWGWGEWYRKVNSATGEKSKTQLAMDEITKMPLTPSSELIAKYPLVYTKEKRRGWNNQVWYSYDFDSKDFFHFEIINDEWCVVRLLQRNTEGSCYNNDGYTISDTFDERSRVYINSKGKVTIVELIDGEWHVTSAALNSITGYGRTWKFGNIEDINKWTRLSWISNLVAEYGGKNQLQMIINLLRHPIAEMLLKSGYTNIYQVVAKDNTIAKRIEDMFGIKEKRKGSLTKMLGVNTNELKWLDSKIDYRIIRHDVSWTSCDFNTHAMKVISTAKEVFGLNDISSWSIETINTYFPAVLNMLTKANDWKYYLLPHDEVNTYYWRRNHQNEKLNEEQQKIIQRILKTTAKYPDFIGVYIDTLRMYNCLNNNNRPDITDLYNIRDMETMIHWHNGIMELKTQQDMERRAMYNMEEAKRLEKLQKKFEELQKDRVKKYEYTTDNDEYMIVMPTSQADFVTESTVLSHCVARAYTHRHMSGETDIIFLRRKSMPKTPFFTIEVNGNRLIQCHTKNNAWMGTHPEVIPFMKKWLETKHIRYDKDILLCKSQSYCSGSQYLDGAQFGF